MMALDGEILGDDGVITGAAATDMLLKLFLEHGAAFKPPQGNFAAAFWEPGPRRLVLVTDQLGRRPIYLARDGRSVFFAGELKALVAAGLRPILDLDAWASMLAYEHFLGERTPLEGVRVLPAATTLTVDSAGRERTHSRWRYRLDPIETYDEGELVEEFSGLLRRAVARRLDGATALALSGGLDSRCLASMLLQLAPEATVASYGTADSDDFRLGARVAERAGLKHRPLPLRAGYIASGSADTVWLGEGQVRAFHAHHLALRPLRAQDGARSLLIGYAGDHLLRTVGGPVRTGGDGVLPANFHRYRSACLPDDRIDELFTPALAQMLRGKAKAAMVARLAEEEGEPLARVRQMLWDNQRRKIWPGAEQFADELAPRDPYDDYELVEFGRHIPEAVRTSGSLQLAYLRRFPELAADATTKEGFPPRLTGRRQRWAAKGVKVRRGVRSRLEPRLTTKRWANRHGYSDYAVEIRRGSNALLDMLLESRTLDRGQLREEALRRLVDETRAGRARHTRTLGVLVTFELFQRQFVDGDGFHASEREATCVDAQLEETRT
jgi:asparagine synthetase B (glutamine-hydrolysing)